MSNKDKVSASALDPWESGELGEDLAHAKAISSESAKEIDDALGLQPISIRLDRELIDSFKMLGKYHRIGYQPLMRIALKRFADGELKMVLRDLLESQTKVAAENAPKATTPESDGPKKKVA